MEVLKAPDDVTMTKIKAELRIEDARFLKQIEMFEEWIRCETHLPKNVEKKLVKNFISLCKCDMVKAKKKFENFLIAESQLKFPVCVYDKDFYEEYPVHKDLLAIPQLTPKGYRIIICRFDADPTIFDFGKFIAYGVTLAKYILYEDTQAGYAVIFDLGHLNASHMGKINFRLFAHIATLVLHNYPFRIREFYFLNTSPITQVMVNFIKRILGEKIGKRVILHQTPVALENFVSTLLAEGQTIDTASLNNICEEWKNLLWNSRAWHEKIKHIKLLGAIPHGKANLYSPDEFGINGTFRQLSID